MPDTKSLDSLFKEKIFRIPDYQRGFAWQIDQLKDFWEDLVNLSDDRSHYTGVITINEIAENEISENDNEFWLVDDHSYKMYHIVDGQQRLTTFVIFIQAFIDFFRKMEENSGKDDSEIFITDSLNLEAVANKYLFKVKPTGDQYRSYKFGYTADNPSYHYLKHKIFEEDGGGTVDETFYTLNLRNAKDYFYKQLESVYSSDGIDEIKNIYRKLTKNFMFNEYVIIDQFDVFVAFETMNNRGKKLSDLELLKNRLIYLTTLYTDDELDSAERKSLRNSINDAWKEVYFQLGRNDKKPLNDDEFLKAHWIMYFKYSRQRGNDYIKFLLDEQFSPKKVYKKIERQVKLELPQEHPTDLEFADPEADNVEQENVEYEEIQKIEEALLTPKEIKEYVISLKESAVHWFNSYYPELAAELEETEISAINSLNRIGMGYFRPLVMALYKNEREAEQRIILLEEIERFIFIVFRLCQTRGNYRSSEFYNAARGLDKREINLETIIQKIEDSYADYFNDDGSLNSTYFYNYLDKRFNSGERNGYYGWYGLRYFLYEYEMHLLSKNRQKKVSWDDLLVTKKDKISIEHIFPQTLSVEWEEVFSNIEGKMRSNYSGSLGNLLLLSMSINISLQNDSFEDKKAAKVVNDEKIRGGYSGGSHSEIEVSENDEWGPKEIEVRGLELLSFMERRWKFKFQSEEDKKNLLFLESQDNSNV